VAGTALLAGAYGLRAVSERVGHDPAPTPPPDLDVVRIALIGLGARGGGGHLPLLHRLPGVEITAVCDTNEGGSIRPMTLQCPPGPTNTRSHRRSPREESRGHLGVLAS
jgi:hypothetical protein